MKKFSDFGIKTSSQAFTGDKIKIERVLNREIKVMAYKVEPSKFNENNCLHLQISIGDTPHVIFVASKNLIEQIEQVPKTDFPFITTIVKNDRLEFT